MNRKFLSMAASAVIGILLDGAVLCSPAHAQSWTPDKQYTEGIGIKVGDLEIHPGLAVRGGYDTNVFKADGDTGAGAAGQAVVGAGMLSISPHLNIATKSKQRATGGESGSAPYVPPKLALRAGLSASYFYYFSEQAPNNVEVDSDVWLGILPQQPVNLELAASYQRTTRPFTQSTGAVENGTYANNTVRPSARLNVGSKSQVLTGYAGYGTNVNLYQSSTFDYLNAIRHDVEAGSAWKFIPHTALLYDAKLDLSNYLDEDNPSPAATVRLSDSIGFKTRLGINGALTSRLSMRLMGGYGAGYYDDDALSEYEAFIAEATLGYKFLERHKFELGYARDIQGAATGGWVRSDRGSAALRLSFAQAFALGFEAAYGYLTYGSMVALNGSGMGTGSDPYYRRDHRVDAAIRAEYRATNWLAFMADATFQGTFTDFEYAISQPGGVFPDPAGYVSFQFFGGVRAHY